MAVRGLIRHRASVIQAANYSREIWDLINRRTRTKSRLSKWTIVAWPAEESTQFGVLSLKTIVTKDKVPKKNDLREVYLTWQELVALRWRLVSRVGLGFGVLANVSIPNRCVLAEREYQRLQ